MKPMIMGIDIGTTGCKTALYRQDGTQVAQSYREYKLMHPENGWAEESPEDWWLSVVSNAREVLAFPGIKPEDIAAIGVSCTNGLVAVNKAGDPLLPAVMMLDQRSAPQADCIKKQLGEKRVFDITGNRIAPGAFYAPTMLWIAQERPDIYKQTYKFLVPTGFIVQHLTGQFTIDVSRASVTMLLDIRKRAWSEELLKAMDIDRNKLPQLYESSEVVGRVTAEAAETTGLKAGTPVIAGCVDTVSAAIGAGAVKQGQTFGLLGTVGRVCVVTDGTRFDGRMMNFCHGQEDLWLTNAAINAAGATLRWFRDTFYQYEAAVAKEQDESVYDIMMDEASQADLGGNGLIYLPYLSGERSPLWNGDAKGIIYGLTLAHKRSQIIRALLEGVAYAVRHNLEIIRDEYNVSFNNMTLSNGGARSRLWCRIIGDVTKTNISIPKVLDTEVLGVALLAGVGVGIYSNLAQAVNETVQIARIIPYDAQKAERYDRYFQAYLELVNDMSGRFSQISSLLKV
ncbi:MAG: FGGY family carbohydrate kinase [Veillonellales bacterium]